MVISLLVQPIMNTISDINHNQVVLLQDDNIMMYDDNILMLLHWNTYIYPHRFTNYFHKSPDTISWATLREKCLNTDFFLVLIFWYSVQIQEITDLKKLCIMTLFTQC